MKKLKNLFTLSKIVLLFISKIIRIKDSIKNVKKLTTFISTSIREGNSYLFNIVTICHSKNSRKMNNPYSLIKIIQLS